jgi:hypothetical protein
MLPIIRPLLLKRKVPADKIVQQIRARHRPSAEEMFGHPVRLALIPLVKMIGTGLVREDVDLKF